MDPPKSVSRPKRWSAEVEDAYRFQLAGYRDENEYTHVQKVDEVGDEYFCFQSMILFKKLFRSKPDYLLQFQSFSIFTKFQINLAYYIDDDHYRSLSFSN